MKHEFYKKIIDTTNREYHMVKTEANFIILEHFNFTKKNYAGLQELIDEIEKSKTLQKGNEFRWGNEDVIIHANENGVLLVDEMAQLGGELNPEDITLRLTHSEILAFLQDFKKFIEENI